jgi:hypothetical protein
MVTEAAIVLQCPVMPVMVIKIKETVRVLTLYFPRFLPVAIAACDRPLLSMLLQALSVTADTLIMKGIPDRFLSFLIICRKSAERQLACCVSPVACDAAIRFMRSRMKPVIKKHSRTLQLPENISSRNNKGIFFFPSVFRFMRKRITIVRSSAEKHKTEDEGKEHYWQNRFLHHYP